MHVINERLQVGTATDNFYCCQPRNHKEHVILYDDESLFVTSVSGPLTGPRLRYCAGGWAPVTSESGQVFGLISP